MLKIFIAYEIISYYSWSNYHTLRNCLFGALSLTKNADIDKYKYSEYGIGFDKRRFFFTPYWWNWQKCDNFWSRYEFVYKD